MGRILPESGKDSVKRYVLDTSALVGGLVLTGRGEFFTIDEVLNEAKGLLTKSRLEAGLLSGTVKILSPSESSLEKVKEICVRTCNVISETDAKLLALALDLEATLVTDDYALQNVAAIMGVSIRPITTEGIKEVREWEKFCPSCGRVYERKSKVCEVCGHVLSKRVKKRRRL